MKQVVSLEQMVQAMEERRRELEELGPIIDRRCRVVQTLITSIQANKNELGKDYIKHVVEQQEQELLRLLRREYELRDTSSAVGESPK